VKKGTHEGKKRKAIGGGVRDTREFCSFVTRRREGGKREREEEFISLALLIAKTGLEEIKRRHIAGRKGAYSRGIGKEIHLALLYKGEGRGALLASKGEEKTEALVKFPFWGGKERSIQRHESIAEFPLSFAVHLVGRGGKGERPRQEKSSQKKGRGSPFDREKRKKEKKKEIQGPGMSVVAPKEGGVSMAGWGKKRKKSIESQTREEKKKAFVAAKIHRMLSRRYRGESSALFLSPTKRGERRGGKKEKV